ncbi:MAG TPA: hypothetical protein VGU44_00190 [Gammaproteobacteria bacterium]|nr:hypothetical protein [Gammaproteobacteria bacterium]
MQNQHLHAANSDAKSVSLESVFQAMENWRSNKSKYGATIPDDVWLQIFQLEERYSFPQIRQIFAVTKQAYFNKRAQLLGKKTPEHDEQTPSNVPGGFSEAIIPDTPLQSPQTPATSPLTRTDTKCLKNVYNEIQIKKHPSHLGWQVADVP